MGFEHIHSAVEMVQVERIRSCNTDVFTQPLLITVEFGAGGTGAVGHHGKKGAFDSEVEFAALELIRDDVGEAQALPQRGRNCGECGLPSAFSADSTRSRPAEDA